MCWSIIDLRAMPRSRFRRCQIQCERRNEKSNVHQPTICRSNYRRGVKNVVKKLTAILRILLKINGSCRRGSKTTLCGEGGIVPAYAYIDFKKLPKSVASNSASVISFAILQFSDLLQDGTTVSTTS